ncbi:MAG: SufE family protein [Alphaproteobacteria bacterium]
MSRSLEDLVEDFELFEDWEERYRYIVDLGKKLPPLSSSEMSEDNKVRGCMSQVWLVSEPDTSANPPVVHYRADSDAFIVKGLIAILLELYSGRTPDEIQALDAGEALGKLGLESHLSPNRRNGFVAMVDRIKADAKALV